MKNIDPVTNLSTQPFATKFIHFCTEKEIEINIGHSAYMSKALIFFEVVSS